MQIRFAIEIIKGDTEINRFLEDKDNKLLYASSEYSRPVLTISILTEKEMIEEDKILLNNIIKSKFIHCVDHEKTLSDVQIIYLSRYDVTANIRSLTEQKANTPYLVQILILT